MDNNYQKKIQDFVNNNIYNLKNFNILELGVRKGVSTNIFLNLCDKNNGKLYSIDIDDCSNVSNSKNWNFIKSNDEHFDLIKKKIPPQLDVIFLDTIHEANHVERIFYLYYNLLKPGGFFVIDDISHLPYLKTSKRNNFYCEVNNQETFEKLLNIYENNYKNFELNFSFYSSGLAIIKKLNENNLNPLIKLKLRHKTMKNYLRLLWKKIKGN